MERIQRIYNQLVKQLWGKVTQGLQPVRRSESEDAFLGINDGDLNKAQKMLHARLIEHISSSSILTIHNLSSSPISIVGKLREIRLDDKEEELLHYFYSLLYS